MADTPDLDIVLRIRAELDDARAKIEALEKRVGGLGPAGAQAGAGLKEAEKGAAGVAGKADLAGAAMEMAAGAAKGLAGGLAGIASAATAGKLAAIAEEARQIKEHLAGQLGPVADFNGLYAGIYGTAQEVGRAVKTTADDFVRMRGAADDLGATDAEVLAVVRAVEQLGQESGKSADEIGKIQAGLAKAVEGGVLSAGQFKALVADFPALTRAIEAGAGRAAGSLNRIGPAGIAAVEVFKALAQQSDQIAAASAERTGEIGEAWQRVTNSVGNVVSAIDEATGASETYRDASVAVLDAITAAWEGIGNKIRQTFVDGSLGIDPALTGTERLNALKERQAQLQRDLNRELAAAAAYERAGPFERSIARLDPMAGQRAAETAALLGRVVQAINAIEAEAKSAAAEAAALGSTGEQAGRAIAMAAYAGADGLKRLRADAASAQAAVESMNGAIRGPAPEATVGDQLRRIIGLADEAAAAMSTGDLAAAIPRIREGADLIKQFVTAGGVADGTIGSLALEFTRMGEAAARAAAEGKTAVDAAAKGQHSEIQVTPKLSDGALAALSAEIAAARQTIYVDVVPRIVRAGYAGGGSPSLPAPSALEWEAAKGGDTPAGTAAE